MWLMLFPTSSHVPSGHQNFTIHVNITFAFTVKANMKRILCPSMLHNRYPILVIFAACFYCEVHGLLCYWTTLKQ
jgi:hypothetical protein